MNTPLRFVAVGPDAPRIMRLRRIGAIVWPSFFAAAVATVVFFAIVDPAELADITWPHLAVSRELGYSIGFFMFWACTLGSCTFTALLLSEQAKRKCIECRENERREVGSET